MADEKDLGIIEVRVRGYMGGDVAGGADVDDADREGKPGNLTPSPTIIDPGVTGLPHLCPKCGASVPPAQTSQVCAACTHSLVYPYSTRGYMVGIDPAADGCDVGVTMGDGMMGRIPHVPPTTVAEWVAQTRETGILDFDRLLAISAGFHASDVGKDREARVLATVGNAPPQMCSLRMIIDLMGPNGDIDESENARSCDMPREAAVLARKSLERQWWRSTQETWWSAGKHIPVLPMTEGARLKAKEAIRRLRERDSEIMLDAVADNYARGRDDEREAIATYYAELFQRAPFSVSDMLSDIRRNQHHVPREE